MTIEEEIKDKYCSDCGDKAVSARYGRDLNLQEYVVYLCEHCFYFPGEPKPVDK